MASCLNDRYAPLVCAAYLTSLFKISLAVLVGCCRTHSRQFFGGIGEVIA